ncbi:MAG TPA: DUF3883 domain-containing protein [Actinomycetota bacterium]|nr:DUF3883 domain-containing protein [Actinomycetota bacterium]
MADAEVGRRGEELVLRRELARVAARGVPAERVVWSADTNPAGDHDIKSVADDGGDLWIEVKATNGREGRFTWSRSEFNLAMRERQRYVLCRVYLANTVRPVIRRIQDPIAHLLAGEMRLELNNLAAEVEPL